MNQPQAKALVDSWSVFVDDAADFADDILDQVAERIEDAAIPGAEVSLLGGMIVVTIRNLPAYRQTVRVQAYGAHLHCEHDVTLAPGLVARWMSGLFTGDGLQFARVKKADHVRELRAAITVVHHAVAESCKELVAGMAGSGVNRRLDLNEVLESW